MKITIGNYKQVVRKKGGPAETIMVCISDYDAENQKLLSTISGALKKNVKQIIGNKDGANTSSRGKCFMTFDIKPPNKMIIARAMSLVINKVLDAQSVKAEVSIDSDLQ